MLIPFPCTLFVSKLWCCNVLCKGETVSLVSTSHYGDPVWHLPKCHNIWFRSLFSADTLAPSPSSSLQVTKGKTAKRVRRSSRRFWFCNALISQKSPKARVLRSKTRSQHVAAPDSESFRLRNVHLKTEEPLQQTEHEDFAALKEDSVQAQDRAYFQASNIVGGR